MAGSAVRNFLDPYLARATARSGLGLRVGEGSWPGVSLRWVLLTRMHGLFPGPTGGVVPLAC